MRRKQTEDEENSAQRWEKRQNAVMFLGFKGNLKNTLNFLLKSQPFL